MLRAREAKALDLPSDPAEDELIARMAEEPTLLQRPILVDGDDAVLGRPIERLQEWVRAR